MVWGFQKSQTEEYEPTTFFSFSIKITVFQGTRRTVERWKYLSCILNTVLPRLERISRLVTPSSARLVRLCEKLFCLSDALEFKCKLLGRWGTIKVIWKLSCCICDIIHKNLLRIYFRQSVLTSYKLVISQLVRPLGSRLVRPLF